MERGNISVSTENIFPIIKKSLYSDQEIFLRELVSNAVDAIQKLKYLSGRGEYEGELGELKVEVSVDKDAKQIKVSDNGIGMTEEEVKKYLNQVAFSGAEEFLKKFKDVKDLSEIIGKFGLGFYSAFMVADTVTVVTRSYREDAKAVKWTCNGTTEYTLEEGERHSRGTDVILHVSEDAAEFLEEARIRNILEKYCRFLPVPIFFKEEQINNPNPIWKKPPAELKDEDYKTFFRELYPFDEEPLFWIHLNVDYPFNLTGILYFPKIRQDIDPRKNQIQLYSRQVFITDEVTEIVPEYLMLLKGVIDSPDIPLNVSRSYLQSDSNVRKISSYITRKVADKLSEIFKEDRKAFEQKWDDISVFVKYGMLTDDKFYERAVKFCLLKTTEGEFFTIDEYREKVAENQTDKDKKVVFLYATDKKSQDMYIRSARGRGYEVLYLDGIIDSHFIGLMERKLENTRWVRVDSDTLDNLIPKGEDDKKEEKAEILLTDEQLSKIKEAFVSVLPNKSMQVQTASLGEDEMPVVITRPEFMRRMKDMAALGGGNAFMGEMPDSINVVVNTKHPLVRSIVDSKNNTQLAKQLLDLALLSQNMLEGKDLTDFIHRSVEMIGNNKTKTTARKTRKSAPKSKTKTAKASTAEAKTAAPKEKE
ncbi:MAG: molecular chaperone HtpG [Bacteroidetes bacterium]|nr:MAG: molecular chaperone HtpG [Bacteroidota bacterium]